MKILLTEDVADALKISHIQARALLKSDACPSFHLGSCRGIMDETLFNWLATGPSVNLTSGARKEADGYEDMGGGEQVR